MTQRDGQPFDGEERLVQDDIAGDANTDDWIAAIAAGDAVGVTTIATAATYPNPAVAYLPLIDVPAVTVHLAWKQPPSHPAVPDFIALARRLIPPPRGTTATAQPRTRPPAPGAKSRVRKASPRRW